MEYQTNIRHRLIAGDVITDDQSGRFGQCDFQIIPGHFGLHRLHHLAVIRNHNDARLIPIHSPQVKVPVPDGGGESVTFSRTAPPQNWFLRHFAKVEWGKNHLGVRHRQPGMIENHTYEFFTPLQTHLKGARLSGSDDFVALECLRYIAICQKPKRR